MPIKNDRWIKEMACKHKMIEPFQDGQVEKGVISYGLSSYGYDIRIANEFKVFHNTFGGVVDPKRFSGNNFMSITAETGDCVIVPPNSFALCRSYEYIRVPRNVLVICLGKSTYARCGIVVNVTPLEPEWEGDITVEVSNTTPNPCLIYPNEGIAQLVFLEADEVCLRSYADKKGKYQGQTGITTAKVK